MDDFELSEGEKLHPLWLRLRAHFEDKLKDARMRNDDATKTEAETAELRGQIKCLKRMIALGDAKPMIGMGDGAAS